MAAVKFLVEQETYYLRNSAGEGKDKPSNEDVPKFITLGTDIFERAVEDGRIELLDYLMSKTGLGFPFEALMKEAGVKAETESKEVCKLTMRIT